MAEIPKVELSVLVQLIFDWLSQVQSDSESVSLRERGPELA